MTIPYEKTLQDIIAKLQKAHDEGKVKIGASICVAQLDLACDNSKMRAFAIDTLKIKAKEYDAAIKRRRAEIQLGGRYPQCPREYVALIIKRRGTTVEFNGSCNEPQARYKDFSHIMAEMREEAGELELYFPMTFINDSAEIWFNKAKEARLGVLNELVAYDPALEEEGTAALLKIAETCFDEDPKLVVAAFKKFIHQVKGKMHGLKIDKHLMLVLLGAQEGGKSSLVQAMIDILKEASIQISFTDMANEKIIDMWKNYIGVCDEMVGGNKTDNAAIKHAITAETINRRPMRTTLFITVPQNLTFLGTANATEFQELIRDQTGTRRFIGLQCKPLLDWDTVNATDWQTVWRSVDERAANPMIEMTAEVKAIQETQRQKSRVETWLEKFRPGKTTPELEIGQRVGSHQIYRWFRVYEEDYFPGFLKTDITWFGRQLGAMKNCPFDRAKKHGFWIWNPKTEIPTDESDDEAADKVVRMNILKDGLI